MNTTIQQFHRQFPDNDACLQFLFKLQYPTVTCPKCERKNSYHRHSNKLCFTCNCGQSQIFPQVNTIFENSPIPLKKWFYALFLMSSTPNGVSAKELERRLEITYPSAWRMAKKLRSALAASSQPATVQDAIALCVQK